MYKDLEVILKRLAKLASQLDELERDFNLALYKLEFAEAHRKVPALAAPK